MNATADTTTAVYSKQTNAEDQEVSQLLRGRQRPRLGPVLWTFGVLVWTFTVAGEFTTAGFIGEGLAIALVLIVTVTTALIATGRSLVASPGKFGRRMALTGALTLALVLLFAVLLVSLLRSFDAPSDVGVTLFLLALGAAAAWRGSRWTGVANEPSKRPVAVLLATATVALSVGTIVHVLMVN